MEWLIVTAYLAFVLAVTGWVSYLFIVDRLPTALPFALFVAVLAVGWLAQVGLDRVQVNLT